ncbi:MAG: PfkB family carbohydrate kinase, partial [Patescibacteria group bacterium]
MKLFVLGSVAFDEVARFDGRFSDVIKPELLEKLSVSFFVENKQHFFGGCAGNISYGLGYLKTPATILGVIGNDAANYEARLKGLNISTEYLQKTEDRTAVASIMSDQMECQIAFFSPGAMANKTVTFTLPGITKEGDILLVGPETKDRMLAAIDQAYEKKLRIFFDPGQVIHIFNAEELQSILSKVELVFVNEYELELLKSISGWDEETLLEKIPVFVVTRGEKGAGLFIKGEATRIEAYKPVKLGEPTGAGD